MGMKLRFVGLIPLGGVPVNPGQMEWWITNRIPFWVAAPASGHTGEMESWITDRIYLDNWAGRV